VTAGASPSETIAAIATGAGPGGVGIVRISGPDAFAVADTLHRASGVTGLQAGHTLRRVLLREPESGEPIDDALLAVFHTPRSLTGEDVVELQCHGGVVTLQRVLSAALRSGARLARPGEFTERAFLNGKLDLAQAEAVADLVNAQTVTAQRAAVRQVSGALSHAVREITHHLSGALALIEASIDFPEEIGDADPAAVDTLLGQAEVGIQTLLQSAAYGRRLTEGLTIVLAGRPNVGKSSLLNALSGTERAIVTPIAGTTRDVVEEALNLEGIPVRALDTAGVRDTDDPVERIGVERARAAIQSADVVVVVLDTTAPPEDDDTALIHSLMGRPFVVAWNKSDITPPLAFVPWSDVRANVAEVATSATTGAGLKELSLAIVHAITDDAGSNAFRESNPPLVTSARHEAALRRSGESIAAARATLASGLPIELIAVDTHGALHALGEITGETTREEIIAGIFARFCLGK